MLSEVKREGEIEDFFFKCLALAKHAKKMLKIASSFYLPMGKS